MHTERGRDQTEWEGEGRDSRFVKESRSFKSAREEPGGDGGWRGDVESSSSALRFFPLVGLGEGGGRIRAAAGLSWLVATTPPRGDLVSGSTSNRARTLLIASRLAFLRVRGLGLVAFAARFFPGGELSLASLRTAWTELPTTLSPVTQRRGRDLGEVGLRGTLLEEP